MTKIMRKQDSNEGKFVPLLRTEEKLEENNRRICFYFSYYFAAVFFLCIPRIWSDKIQNTQLHVNETKNDNKDKRDDKIDYFACLGSIDKRLLP